jgi:hypothetical protein
MPGGEVQMDAPRADDEPGRVVERVLLPSSQVANVAPTLDSQISAQMSKAVSVAVVRLVSLEYIDVDQFPFVATVYRVGVDRVLFGTPPERIMVLGGRRGADHIINAESPQPALNQQVLGFFWESSLGLELAFANEILDGGQVLVNGEGYTLSEVEGIVLSRTDASHDALGTGGQGHEK